METFDTYKLDLRPIYLEWVDSKGVSSEWEHTDGLNRLEPVLVKTVGFIETETKERITILQNFTLDEDGKGAQVCGRITIPRVAIKKRKLIRLKSKRKKK